MWERPREVMYADLWNDGNNRPLIGFPLGKKVMILEGAITKPGFKMGRLIGWQGDSPVIQYSDNTCEVIESLSYTNWKA